MSFILVYVHGKTAACCAQKRAKSKVWNKTVDLVLYFYHPELEKHDIFAELELEKIKLENSDWLKETELELELN